MDSRRSTATAAVVVVFRARRSCRGEAEQTLGHYSLIVI